MNDFTDFDDLEIENALLNAAPTLPETLKSRTLRRCETSVQMRARQNRRTQRTLWGAVVAVFAVQWLVASQLDANNALWSNGSPPPLIAQSESASHTHWSGLWHARALLSRWDDDVNKGETLR